ncbi:hypothetical protein [Corynebacterium mastitidis]
MVNADVLVRRFAARVFGENWPVVLGVAEVIRSRGVAVPQVGDVQAVDEYFKAHVPVAVWEAAQGYADAVVEEWEVASGALSQRSRAQRSKTALTALLQGDQSVLLQQQARGGVESAQMDLMMAQAAVGQAKDQRQRAEAEAKVAKARARVQEHQDKAQARRLAALVVVLGREYSLADEYEKIVGLVGPEADGDAHVDREAAPDNDEDNQDEVAGGVLQHGAGGQVQGDGDREVPRVSKSPILPKFLKK